MVEQLNIHLSKIRVDLPNGRCLFSFKELEIPYGEHVLIQGPSGSGKTTLLHLIAGLLYPSDGTVKIGNTRLSVLNENQLCEIRRARIGVIFQKLNLLDHMTVAENISLSFIGKESQRKTEIDKAIEYVNLRGRENDRCSYLSPGEQQRVAVARVLAQNPDVILADEPTSSLDEVNGRFVMSALKGVAHGKTLIVVSHDQRISNHFDRHLPFLELTK